MGIQTPTNCGHRVDGGVLNPMARRQIVRRYPNDREKPPAFCPLPSASQPMADKGTIGQLSWHLVVPE